MKDLDPCSPGGTPAPYQAPPPHKPYDPDEVPTTCSKIESHLCRFVVDDDLRCALMHTYIVPCVFLCLLVTNCHGERAFSIRQKLI